MDKAQAWFIIHLRPVCHGRLRSEAFAAHDFKAIQFAVIHDGGGFHNVIAFDGSKLTDVGAFRESGHFPSLL